MAVASSETLSLNDINYSGKIKTFLLVGIGLFLFVMSFLNFYPIGDKLKAQIKTHLKGSACNPDWDQLRLEWFVPKVVISDLELPASCFNRMGPPIKMSYVKLNYHLINLSPFGLPFKLETEMNGQPLELYYVLGFGQQMIRMKDQKIVLSRLEPLMGSNFKLAGAITLDLNLLMNNNVMKSLSFKAASKDLQLPSQTIQGFTLPNLKLNELFIEANSTTPPRITVDKFIVGDKASPIRANFKGKVELQQGAAAFSPMDLKGEVAFSETLKQSLPLVDMMFQSFAQKDGFYQIRLGGTLGAPKPMAP